LLDKGQASKSYIFGVGVMPHFTLRVFDKTGYFNSMWLACCFVKNETIYIKKITFILKKQAFYCCFFLLINMNFLHLISDESKNRTEINLDEKLEARSTGSDVIEADDDVTMVSEADDISLDSTEVPLNVKDVKERPSSPLVPNLVRQFESLKEVSFKKIIVICLFIFH
jgi:hypothetical protein